MLTERDIMSVLLPVVTYYVLSRQQIQRIGFRDDHAGRVTRRRIQVAVDAGYIHRHTLFPYTPTLGAPAPVYYPTKLGIEFLAQHLGDERYLNVNTQAPNANNLLHWLAISESHITIDQAIAAQAAVKLDGWINEFDVVNKEESRPEKRFHLYTLLRESPRLVCAPDAAFLLNLRGFKKVLYLEQDRGTSGVQHLAAGRPKGYAALLEQKLHRRHFPDTNLDSFTVIMLTTTPNRRDFLRKAFRNVPGASLWKFVAQADFTSANFLHAPIFYPVEGNATPLIKPEAVSTPDATTGNQVSNQP